MIILNSFNLTEQTKKSILGNIKKVIKYCLQISQNREVEIEKEITKPYRCKLKGLESKLKIVKFSSDSAYIFDMRDEIVCELEDTEKLLQKLEKLSVMIQSDWVEEVADILYEKSISEAISYIESKISSTSRDDLDYVDMLFYKANLFRLNRDFERAIDVYELLLGVEFSFKYIFEYACFLQYSVDNYELSEILHRELLAMPLLPEQRAQTLYCLASMHFSESKFDLCEKEYQEALNFYKMNDDTLEYRGIIADILYKLALIQVREGDIEKLKLAESKFDDALFNYKSLMMKFPKEYLHKIAEVLAQLAKLHLKIGKKDLAKKEYVELFKRYKVLAKEYPNRYYHKIKKVNQVLVNF